MKKVIFFGAAGAGRSYCKHSNTLPDFFVDNDKNKWNKKILNREIKNPDTIQHNEIEYIVITSGYIKSILPQILKLGVPRDKIKVPPKSMLGEHPFENKINRKESAKLLYDLKNNFSNSNIVAVGGTALGFVRDSDFIKWDFDIDLFAPIKIKNELLNFLEKKGYKPFIENIFSIKGEFQLRTGDIVPFAIDLFNSEEEYFLDIYEDHKWEWPTDMFTNCSHVEIQGFEMNIPNPAKLYLKGIYGKDWEKPKPDFNYFDYGK